MPIDEIYFAVLCSITVTDEFELQLTKTGDKSRNLMTMFQNWSTKDEIEMSIPHSRVPGTKLKAHYFFLLHILMKRWRKWAGKPILGPIYTRHVIRCLFLLQQPHAFQYLPQMNCTQYAYIILYKFLLFTLYCILCIPFIFCFNCNFAERRKQINSIQFNSIHRQNANELSVFW